MKSNVIWIGRRPEDVDPKYEVLSRENLQEIEGVFKGISKRVSKVVFHFGFIRGGDILAALHFAKVIIESPVHTVAVGYSFVGSAGGVIFVAPDKRVLYEDGQILLHRETHHLRGSLFSGDQNNLRRHRRSMKRIEKLTRDILFAQTNLTVKEIDEILNSQTEDYPFSSHEALRVGLVHEILKVHTQLEMKF